jgi:hypothetical protein
MNEWITGFIIGLCVGVGAMSATGHSECKLGGREKKILETVVAIAGILLAVSVIAPRVMK